MVVDNSVAVTGSIMAGLRTAKSLSGQFDFLFLLPTGSAAINKVTTEGFRTAEIPFLEINKSLKALLYIPVLLMNLIRFRRLISKEKPRLIVVNDFYNLLPALYRAMGGRIPYLTYVRFVPSRFPQRLVSFWCRQHYRHASKVIAVSSVVMKDLPVHNKVTMIYDGIPSVDEVTSMLYNADSRSILYLSNYIRGKGQDLALLVFSAIHEQFPEWTMTFAGGDMGLDKNREFKQELQSLAGKLGVAHKIQWLDFSNDNRELFEKSGLILNFSSSESFSLTVVESLLSGRPVIATASGGPQEIITSGVNGELVPVGDIEKMEAILSELLRDHTRREQYALNAEKSVREKFSEANTTRRIADLYNNLLSPSW